MYILYLVLGTTQVIYLAWKWDVRSLSMVCVALNDITRKVDGPKLGENLTKAVCSCTATKKKMVIWVLPILGIADAHTPEHK